MDLEQRIQGFNDTLIKLLGKQSARSLKGANEEDLITSESFELLATLDQVAIESGTPQHAKDVHVYLPDGRDAYLEISRIPLLDDQQKASALLVTYLDVTERHQAKRKAEEQREKLEERNQAIEFDLDSARQIQKFLMGKQADTCPYLDVAFRYRYMEKVGGDYLCFRSLEGGAYSLLIADLTGHGVTAALFMALLKYISQETPEEVRRLPGYFLNYLDMEFYEQIPNGFFTAFAATARYDEEMKRVKVDYANAAHPASIIVRKDGSYELLDSGEFAVGLLDLVERPSHTIQLNFGDRLYAYTDGFLESIDPDGNEFGLERLCEVLTNCRDLNVEESIQKAFDRLGIFCQSDKAQDDLTILAIEAKERTKAEPNLNSNEDPWGAN